MPVISGPLTFSINGERQWASGDWTYTLGTPKRSGRMESSGKLVGWDEDPMAATIKGTMIDRSDFDLGALFTLADATLQIGPANGKTVVFSGAFFSGSGEIKANSAEIDVEFTAASAEEIKS